jgi:hypothetical protein
LTGDVKPSTAKQNRASKSVRLQGQCCDLIDGGLEKGGVIFAGRSYGKDSGY